MEGLLHPTLSNDPVLDAIDREERRPVVNELAALLGSGYAWLVGGELIPVPMPPPGVFGLLTALESPLLDPAGQPTPDDLRIAGLLILKGRAAGISDAESGAAVAAGFWANAVPERADVNTVIRDAFMPYLRLPPSDRTGDKGEPLRADSAFLAGLVARVHRVTGLSPDAILWRLPMAAAALYDLQFRRYELRMVFNDTLPPSDELIRRRWARINELLEAKP